MEEFSTTIKMDRELAMQFKSLCKEFGMNINSAINTLVRNSVRQKSIQSEVEDEKDKARREFGEIFERMRKRAADIPEMSLEEINAEIAACRAEIR